MTIRSLSALLISVFLVACGPTARVELPTTHPAHAEAEESPVPTSSTTLVIGLIPLAPAVAPADEDHSQHQQPAKATAPASTGTKPSDEDHSQHPKPGKEP